jgi:hypothetical protein
MIPQSRMFFMVSHFLRDELRLRQCSNLSFVGINNRQVTVALPMNAINVIAPYKWHDIWVFDDEQSKKRKREQSRRGDAPTGGPIGPDSAQYRSKLGDVAHSFVKRSGNGTGALFYD